MIQLNVTFLFSEIYLGNIATFIIFKIWNKIEITETVSEMVYTEDYLKEKLTKELEAEVCEVNILCNKMYYTMKISYLMVFDVPIRFILC